jgi:hypothetical protein
MQISVRFVGIGLGVALGAACLLAMAPTFGTYHGKAVTFGPDPWNMVQIREGTPYVVPAGKTFVLTALGSNQLAADLTILTVDGKAANSGVFSSGFSAAGAIRPVPIGFAASGGSVLDIVGGKANSQDARAWGFLSANGVGGPTASTDTLWVNYGPAPESLVQIQAGTPYAVPVNRTFVVTAFGSIDPSPATVLNHTRLEIDGVLELSTYDTTGDINGAMHPVPPGLTASPGSTISIVDYSGVPAPTGTTFGRCWGYLANR